MSNIITVKIELSIRECDLHLEKIVKAAARLQGVFPLTEDKLTELSDETVTILDQFIYRFTKLQDAMGARIMPLISGLISDNFDPRPFIDHLNILEKNGAISSAEKWQELRNLRNSLAHEYPDNTGAAEVLNLLMSEWINLRDMYYFLKLYYETRLK